MADASQLDYTLAAAQANALAGVTAEVGILNDSRKSNYLTAFNNWATSVLAGRISNANPPVPPKAFLVATGADGWAYPAEGPDPICPMPTVPPDYSQPTPTVMMEPVNVRNVPAGDTMPVGYIATAPDGTRWQKQASPTPFGVAYFYARVS
jgi:hypothetical protein